MKFSVRNKNDLRYQKANKNYVWDFEIIVNRFLNIFLVIAVLNVKVEPYLDFA